MALSKIGTDGISADTAVNGFTPTESNMAGRNKIINGSMVFDQRNAGASVTPSNFNYLTDRWQYRASQSSKFDAQQSTTVPSGHKNSLLFTSSSAYSVGSGEQFGVRQFIEGLNMSDLAWGTADAKTVTLSFWVRSSLTGTHSGALGNNGDARAYPFSYTISSADTWEQKSITIAGDTSGTWLTTNGIGMKVSFNLGAGSTMLATAGAWTTGEIVGATGSVSVVGTSGATFYITGVQLEAGSVATPFERRQYGQELALCERYCQRGNDHMIMHMINAGLGVLPWRNCTEFRATPTAIGNATPYVENTPWNAIGSASGVSYNMAHMNPRGGEIGVFGSYSPTPSMGQTWLLNAGSLILSAEL